MPRPYRDVLTDLVGCCPKPRVVAEVGVHRGRTTELLLSQFPDLHLHAVDAWAPYSEATADMQAKHKDEAMKRIARYMCRCTIYHGLSTASARICPPCDLVFIDAAHDEPSVYDDCRSWWNVVKPGGVLCGHDYGKGLGVDAAVQRLMKTHLKNGFELTLHDGNIWSVRKSA